jgi:hypothetical protein
MTRLLLSLGTLAFAGTVYLLMLKGWRHRLDRQVDLPAPATALGDAVVMAQEPGLFVGTTGAENWLDRIAVHRLSDRGRGTLAVATDGVHVDRAGLPELYLPLSALESVSIEDSLAGKVVSGGMLVLTWRLGDRSVASAFRADDHSAHARLQSLLEPLLEAV